MTERPPNRITDEDLGIPVFHHVTLSGGEVQAMPEPVVTAEVGVDPPFTYADLSRAAEAVADRGVYTYSCPVVSVNELAEIVALAFSKTKENVLRLDDFMEALDGFLATAHSERLDEGQFLARMEQRANELAGQPQENRVLGPRIDTVLIDDVPPSEDIDGNHGGPVNPTPAPF